MRLTRQSEIAIGMLTVCAAAPDRKLQTKYLAARTGTTKDHAAQLVSLLVRHGLLASHRGRNGGVRLGADAGTIAIAEVLQLTQPELVQISHAGSHLIAGAVRMDMLVEASSAFFSRLMKRFTIADLVANDGDGRTGCLDCGLMNPARLPDQLAKNLPDQPLNTPRSMPNRDRATEPPTLRLNGRSISIERRAAHAYTHS
ncbi:Rrf2 family transcriptional regulator [Brucella pseudogrignonensis]|uniref:Rrf2 family transcriptional regulator n=1 Tax=Brucella pseudogrignonensis TaxID=419475 RepID=UPI001E5E9C81|nr:Rrf2 family transcriptional regulator [Brucella pseudogrignonensis]MCD4512135.1 Rrf2 family transcriptional regulator [Brucella pseudogrignonensis]